ncbi:MAG: FKBP-type peptidyl-prolyl cis-trans isomerase [Bacteroidia bacterium]
MHRIWIGLIAIGWLGCNSPPSPTLKSNPPAPLPQTSFEPYAIDSTKIQVYPSGLRIYVHQLGSGQKPQPGQRVVVHYHGILAGGGVFDSSYERNQPFSFVLGQNEVIKGWEEGIALLPVGTKAVLIIPPDLGYGQGGAPPVIPPNTTLTFYVEVLGIL